MEAFELKQPSELKQKISVIRFGKRVEKHSRLATLQASGHLPCSAHKLTIVARSIDKKNTKARNRTTQIKGTKRYMELPPDRQYRDKMSECLKLHSRLQMDAVVTLRSLTA